MTITDEELIKLAIESDPTSEEDYHMGCEDAGYQSGFIDGYRACETQHDINKSEMIRVSPEVIQNLADKTHEIIVLKAQLKQVEARNAWRKVEDAPKENEDILFYAEHPEDGHRLYVFGYYAREAFQDNEYTYGDNVFAWRPLNLPEWMK